MTMRAKLETRQLSKSFRKGQVVTEVLRDLDIDIYPGEFVSIVGASGCGKTTFLRLVDGLIEPTRGTVAIDGEAVTRPGDRIAFVFQQDGLLPWRTVTGNAALGPEIQGRDRGTAHGIAEKFLRLVGLAGFGRHFPHELSGGMRQRVNLARALSAGADVLLMDEPFAALDAQTRELMQAELLRIWAEARKTVLFITHQIDEAIYLSDRVLVMSARPGRILADIPIDLPRPRELRIKRTPEFTALADRIWELIAPQLRSDVRAAD